MNRLNRTTRIIIGVVTAFLVIGGILLALSLTIWAQPSKQDFSDAMAKAEKIKTYSGLTLLKEFSQKVIAGSDENKSQQALIDHAAEEKKKTEDALNNRMKLSKEIGEGAAVGDKEVAKAYATYQAREIRYSNYVRDYMNTYPVYQSSFTTCLDVFTFTRSVTNPNEYAAAQRKASEDCIVDLKQFEKSPITPFASYAKDFMSIINDRQVIFDALERKEIDPDKETSKKISDITSRYSKISISKELREYGEAATFNNELNDLIKLLDEKVKTTE